MKFLLVLCFVGLVSNARAKQDLSSKMFVFPKESDTAYVKLTPSVETLSAVTVCHRSITELSRKHSLFSLDVPNAAGGNAFLMFGYPTTQQVEATVMNTLGLFKADYIINKWNSICATWSSATGLVQMWVNGQPLTMKSSIQTPISGKPLVTLGQDQDTYGGGFEIDQSFVGMMTDVHMWDRVLSPCEIQKFMKDRAFAPGNVLNWAALDYELIGKVLVEKKQTGCLSCI